MSVLSISVRLVSLPRSLILVSIDMQEYSLAMGLIVLPVAFVLCPIWPNLHSKSVSDIVLPLTLVPGSIFKDEFISLLAIVEIFLLALLRLFVPIFFVLEVNVLVISNTTKVGGACQSYTLSINSSMHAPNTQALGCTVVVATHLV